MNAADLPMIGAVSLFLRCGPDCVADVPLADGTLPVNGLWRIEPREWAAYRAECAAAAAFARALAREVEREGCAS